jgi:hypothetical protein
VDVTKRPKSAAILQVQCIGTVRAFEVDNSMHGDENMIRVDAGKDLQELMTRAEQLGPAARLDVAIPFYDTDSDLWRRLMATTQAGSRVRLLTRPPADQLTFDLFGDLTDMGVRLVHLPTIHAKSIMLSDLGGRHSMGWIGSHNFTKASERTALELGITFSGPGGVENRLLQQTLLRFDAWEHQARMNRKKA